MVIWETITITLVSAAVAFTVSRLTSHFDRRAVDRAADAQWTPIILHRISGTGMVAAVITNTGTKQALDVTLKLGGNGVIEFDADLDMTRIRPGESIRFVIKEIGNSVAYIEWTNHLGIRDQPFNLFLNILGSEQAEHPTCPPRL